MVASFVEALGAKGWHQREIAQQKFQTALQGREDICEIIWTTIAEHADPEVRMRLTLAARQTCSLAFYPCTPSALSNGIWSVETTGKGSVEFLPDGAIKIDTRDRKYDTAVLRLNLPPTVPEGKWVFEAEVEIPEAPVGTAFVSGVNVDCQGHWMLLWQDRATTHSKKTHWVKADFTQPVTLRAEWIDGKGFYNLNDGLNYDLNPTGRQNAPLKIALGDNSRGASGVAIWRNIRVSIHRADD